MAQKDMGKQYHKLKQARLLYALFKTMKSQIGDQPLKEDQKYKLVLSGKFILAIYSISKAMFNETDNLKRLGF